MKAVIQRVTGAELSVENALISEIGAGLVVYLGIESGDSKEQADYIAKKIANMRIFNDDNGKMNYSVLDKGFEILVVSQFTLCADVSGGNRPSFVFAEEPKRANELYEYTCGQLALYGVSVKKGVFGADMRIEQHNIGPVTIILQG